MNDKKASFLSVIETIIIFFLVALCSAILLLKIYDMHKISYGLDKNREMIQRDIGEAVELKELAKSIVSTRAQQYETIDRKLDEIIELLKKRSNVRKNEASE
jgi:F0F1-type ATP synthase membrane subunit b/b'